MDIYSMGIEEASTLIESKLAEQEGLWELMNVEEEHRIPYPVAGFVFIVKELVPGGYGEGSISRGFLRPDFWEIEWD